MPALGLSGFSLTQIDEPCQCSGAHIVLKTQRKGGPLNEGVAKALAQEGQLLDIQITDRLAHPAAMTEGKTAGEVDKASQREAAKLWKSLEDVLATASPAPSKRATVIR